MGVFDVEEASTQLAKLLEQVEQGEEVIIARSGRPVAKLVRIAVEPRIPGRLKGRIWIAPDFDDPLPDDFLSSSTSPRS